MSNYIINSDTYVLYDNKVLEKYEKFNVDKLLIEVIDDSCLYYGSSYKGRVKATNYMIGQCYKCPIIISEYKSIVFFPVLSNFGDIYWFSYNNISNYYKNGEKIVILFKNNIKKEFEISIVLFNKQYFKSARLNNVLNAHK